MDGWIIWYTFPHLWYKDRPLTLFGIQCRSSSPSPSVDSPRCSAVLPFFISLPVIDIPLIAVCSHWQRSMLRCSIRSDDKSPAKWCCWGLFCDTLRLISTCHGLSSGKKMDLSSEIGFKMNGPRLCGKVSWFPDRLVYWLKARLFSVVVFVVQPFWPLMWWTGGILGGFTAATVLWLDSGSRDPCDRKLYTSRQLPAILNWLCRNVSEPSNNWNWCKWEWDFDQVQIWFTALRWPSMTKWAVYPCSLMLSWKLLSITVD